MAWNPLKDLEDIFDGAKKDPIGSLVNLATTLASAGLMSYEEGGFTSGSSVRFLDESIGEISGRNMQRKQLMLNQDAINEEKEARALEQRNVLARRQNQDKDASQRAGFLRDYADFKNSSLLGGDASQDFLGL